MGAKKYTPTQRMDWPYPTKATDILIEKLNELQDQKLKGKLLKNICDLAAYADIILTARHSFGHAETLLHVAYKSCIDRNERYNFDDLGDRGPKIKSTFNSMLHALFRNRLKLLRMAREKHEIIVQARREYVQSIKEKRVAQ